MNKIHKFNFYLPPLFWMAIIFTLSSYQTPGASEFFWVDFAVKKTIHVMEYGLLWILVYRMLKNTTKLSLGSLVLWSLLITIAYGASDEWHQTWVPTRTGRPRDVGFDTLGALIASLAVIKWLPQAPQKIKFWAKSWKIT